MSERQHTPWTTTCPREDCIILCSLIPVYSTELEHGAALEICKADSKFLSLILAAPALLAACEEALPVMREAVRAGIEGFSQAEVEDIVNNHVTVKALTAALAQAKSASAGTP